jgi:pimeloyl-ACP methyl ester carboxylesterase
MNEPSANRASSSRPSQHLAIFDKQMVHANGVDLCAQTFGDPADLPILLIHGAATPMDGWEVEFCQRLAAGPRFVIRYDLRDTGRSVSYPPGHLGYNLRDLAADAIGLLDAYGLPAAHLVGRSLGGGIAMLAALDQPERVASLTVIGASPGGDDLPPMSREFLTYIQQPAPDWTDREAVVDYIVGLLRIYSGGSGHFEEARMRQEVSRGLARTNNVAASQINHFAIDVGPPLRGRLAEITAPTLVVHGDADPIFPLGHAEALAREIPHARLLVLAGIGHELPPATWDVVVPALLEQTSRPRLPSGRNV